MRGHTKSNPYITVTQRHKKKVQLPAGWPSDLHNKCSAPTCAFPNPPQAAEGKYSCLSRVRGLSCEGTYYVTHSMAARMVKTSDFPARPPLIFEAKTKEKKPLSAEKSQADKEQGAPNSDARSMSGRSSRQVALNKDKNLPGIPGLEQRKRRLRRSISCHPSLITVQPEPAPPIHQPLYPGAVQQYFAQGPPVYASRPSSRAPSMQSVYSNVTSVVPRSPTSVRHGRL